MKLRLASVYQYVTGSKVEFDFHKRSHAYSWIAMCLLLAR